MNSIGYRAIHRTSFLYMLAWSNKTIPIPESARFRASACEARVTSIFWLMMMMMFIYARDRAEPIGSYRRSAKPTLAMS
jgi:hypothetical protein